MENLALQLSQLLETGAALTPEILSRYTGMVQETLQLKIYWNWIVFGIGWGSIGLGLIIFALATYFLPDNEFFEVLFAVLVSLGGVSVLLTTVNFFILRAELRIFNLDPEMYILREIFSH